MQRVVETEILWHDVTKWNPDFIYPCPVGYEGGGPYVIDGWMLFKQDKDCNEDMDCVEGFDAMTFSQALAICEMHNKEKLIK